MSRRSQLRIAALIAAALLAWAGNHFGFAVDGSRDIGRAQVDPGSIEKAYAAQRSDLWVEAGGTVTKTLPDDRDGSPHQRFIVELASGHTVLIAHNIELAERVPVSRGDTVRFRGEYEWNHRGGVVHWTHHDPKGRHGGGWIEHAGRRYH